MKRVSKGEWFVWGDGIWEALEGGARVTPGMVSNAREVCRVEQPEDEPLYSAEELLAIFNQGRRRKRGERP
jgi:hypothetical protein